jgi:zinc D-Ala-D-Ala carboxypeptidase
MNLSPHFTLAEMTVSETAARRGIDNDPPPDVVERLKHTALGLEAVRIRLGAPIVVSSGYRSPALNAAIGGAQNSDHTRGDAADFICPGFGAPSTIVSALKDSGIQFDQLIEEFGRWVHISFGPRMRGQVLRIDRNGTRPWM